MGTLKVIIDMHVLIVIFVNCFGFVFVGVFFSPFLVVWWLSLVQCLDCFFKFVYVPIIDFWFAVNPEVWYRNIYIYIYIYICIYIYMIVLSCWSLNCKCISTILHFTHLFSHFLVLIAYLFVEGFLSLLHVCLYWWDLSFVIFLFTVVAYSIPAREIPFIFVVMLV